MPLIFKDGYYKPVEKDLQNYFYELYWADILNAIKDPAYLLNSQSALIAAIRSGKIQYKNGVFSGTFNSKTSGALSKFAKFDGRTKTWKGIPPAPVSAAATIANSKGEALNRKINSLIDDIPARVEGAIDALKYQIEAPLFAMNQEADKDIVSLGLKPNESKDLNKRIVENYTENLNISIQNWTPDQTEKLRDMVERNVLQGYNRKELIAMISSEYEVSMKKATFLAKQETSLFMAEVRDSRYEDAGIDKYKWSSSHDIRVRELHKELNGQVFSYDSPPVIDERTGERGRPGQAFGCRCTAIPII